MLRKLFKPFYYTTNTGKVVFTIILSVVFASIVLLFATLNPACIVAAFVWFLLYLMLTAECYRDAP